MNTLIAKTPVSGEDYQKNKLLAGLGYLPVLFFVPLVACPDSKLGKRCANQGLTLLAILAIVWLVMLLFSWIPIVRFITNAACGLIMAADVAFGVYCLFMLNTNALVVELPYSLNVFGR